MSSASAQSPSIEAIFQKKYEEFANDLKDVFPELEVAVTAALRLTATQRWDQYKQYVLTLGGRPDRPVTACPGMVLPGVVITPELWSGVSQLTKDAIQKYLSILTFSFIMKDGPGSMDLSGGVFKEWADKFLGDWRSKMGRADFDSFAKRMAEMFGPGGQRLPPFPDRLKHGKLAKLAEEIVKELKPEEFGLDPEVLRRCEADPSQAFEILMQTTMQNPEKLQNAMKKIIGRLQEKFQKGQFRPQDLVAEAEEMMKEFSENPAFVEMMESMRSTFGFEDMDMARAAGREGSARLSMVQQRLRREMARRTAATTSVPVSQESMAAAEAAAAAATAELLAMDAKDTKKKGSNKKR
jgi:hypothetical protein